MSPPRRSKRARAHPPQPEPDPKPEPDTGPSNGVLRDRDYPNIEFRDIEHYTRFQALKVRRTLPTRFYSDGCVTALGIKADLEWLFDRVGWRTLMFNQHLTFHELTLEFLSSFEQNTVKVPRGQFPGVRFRMFNREFSNSLDEFGEFFGLRSGGCVHYYNSDPSQTWRHITGCDDYNPQCSKASRIHNPVFRYLQRLMASTIFGRHDSQGTVREWEMEMIQSMLYPDVQLSTASYIARHFHAVGKSRKKSPIVIGGLVTPIAAALGFDLGEIQPVGAIPTLDITSLVSMHWLQEDGDRYRWVVNKNPAFHLPNPKRTTIRNQANWVFIDLFSSDGEEENGEANCEGPYQTSPPPFFVQEEGVCGSPSPPMPQDSPPQGGGADFAALLASLDSIRTGIQSIQASQLYMNQRLDQFDQMLYPIYNWHVQRGHIDPNTLTYPDSKYPHPYYRPPDPPGF